MGDQDDNDSVSVSARIPNRLFILVSAGLLAGGMGIGTILPQRIESSAIQACFNNASVALKAAEKATGLAATALDVSGQHGQENVTINARIDRTFDELRRLNVDLLERTYSRHTQEDQEEHLKVVREKYTGIQERLAQHERRMNSHEKDLDHLVDLHQRGKPHIKGQ